MPFDLYAGSVDGANGSVGDLRSNTVSRNQRDRVGHEQIIAGTKNADLQNDPRVALASCDRSRSSHSSRGIAYLREMPVHSLKSATVKLGLCGRRAIA